MISPDVSQLRLDFVHFSMVSIVEHHHAYVAFVDAFYSAWKWVVLVMPCLGAIREKNMQPTTVYETYSI